MNREEVISTILDLDAMQKPEELADLVMFLETMKPKSIVELGTCNGGSTATFKTFFPEAIVIGVDWVLFPAYKDKEDKYGFLTVHGDSHDKSTLDKVLELIPDRKIDFVFIDTEHSDENVRKDFALWSPYSKMIGFHDIRKSSSRPDLQVYKLWGEVIKKRKHAEFIYKDDTWGGIGVLL